MEENKPNYLLEAVKNVFVSLPGGKVLDLGCGDGDYSERLKDLGFEVVASDMDSERFKYHKSIKFVKSNISEPLPFPDESFDYVLFLEVLEHLYNPDFVIKQISRLIKPGGLLLISTPNILNLGSRMRFLFEGSFDFFREPILDYSKLLPSGIQNMHIIPWRYQEIEYLLYKNGLNTEKIYTDLMKPSLRFFSFIFLPLLRFQAWQKERRAIKKGGVDYKRITKFYSRKNYFLAGT